MSAVPLGGASRPFVGVHRVSPAQPAKPAQPAQPDHAADAEVVSKADRERFRAEALQARRTLKMARKLAKSSEPLSTAQRALVLQLEAGELEKVTLQKNQAYGHGCGATSTSLEEVALFRVSCNQLDNYFGRSE